MGIDEDGGRHAAAERTQGGEVPNNQNETMRIANRKCRNDAQAVRCGFVVAVQLHRGNTQVAGTRVSTNG